MAEQFRLYLVFCGLVGAVVLWNQSVAREPARRSTMVPPVVEIRGLEVRETRELVGFRAELATPREGSTPLTLGAYVAGLDLVDVSIDLGAGFTLHAREGALVGERLSVGGGVWVAQGGRRWLSAARAEFAGEEVYFPGSVVFHRVSGDEVAFDLSVRRDSLLDRLR